MICTTCTGNKHRSITLDVCLDEVPKLNHTQFKAGFLKAVDENNDNDNDDDDYDDGDDGD